MKTMQKKSISVHGVARWGMGAALLALIACTPVTRAGIILDNTADATSTYTTFSGAQVFTMTTSDGNLTSLTLSLGGTGSGNVYIYNTSGGAPTTPLYDLGIITTAFNTITIVNPANFFLNGGGTYAVALKTSAGMGWNYTTDPTVVTAGGASLGGLYLNNGPGLNGSFTGYGGNYFQMSVSVTPVPEVPVTGVAMGFGVLAVALGNTLRRKISAPSAL